MGLQTPFECTKNDMRAGQPNAIQHDLSFLHPEYRVLSELGKGGFGAVFEVINCDHMKLALKVQNRKAECRSNRPSELRKEYEIYKTILQPAGSKAIPAGFAVVHEFEERNGYEYLLIERLGDSLEKIRDRSSGKRLEKSDILMVGIQAVRRLRTLHEKGILHRDMKPSNLVMGCGPNSEKTVYVIDFGVSSVVQDWKEYDYDLDAHFVGTIYYAPVEALYHKAPSRVGDLESLAYTLLFLSNAKLPWVIRDPQTGRRLTDSELADQRVKVNATELCKGFPELTDFVTAVSETQKYFEPDYQHLIALLETALEQVGSHSNGEFSWLKTALKVRSLASIKKVVSEQDIEDKQKKEEIKELSSDLRHGSAERVTASHICSRGKHIQHSASCQEAEERHCSLEEQHQPQTRMCKLFFLSLLILIHWDH